MSLAKEPTGPLALKLRQHRPEVLEALRRHGASNPLVFGSVAGGDEHANSDIDLLIELPETFSLIALIGLEMELAEILGEKVDLSTPDILKPHILAAAEREGLSL